MSLSTRCEPSPPSSRTHFIVQIWTLYPWNINSLWPLAVTTPLPVSCTSDGPLRNGILNIFPFMDGLFHLYNAFKEYGLKTSIHPSMLQCVVEWPSLLSLIRISLQRKLHFIHSFVSQGTQLAFFFDPNETWCCRQWDLRWRRQRQVSRCLDWCYTGPTILVFQSTSYSFTLFYWHFENLLDTSEWNRIQSWLN